MTQENKELLLKDLCARLPYGVKVQPSGSASPHRFVGYDKSLVRIDTDQKFELENIKPYLRPMSSMTEEEKEEIKLLFSKFTDEFGKRVLVVRQNKMVLYQDWLNSHHFDYRGLIEKGLALEASEGMYKEWISIRGNLKEDKEGNIVGGLKL